ncbi:D-alanyl-D-alanine carboxypeptidase/D-alanyl-D-alanine-endopeptidase [Pedobacter sandarakinus]|uniref:D-alanyl-D-alanine carboxypeptidase/D-alanyl-D-alanine-endopeptidase n=1 Tax=Pedobacter sandarakinus TaxID=353156 RepID=UPI0022477B88|nr:D-alanyl-D-alanine carboxypeptidase [Pedobacter sandarakinus]MCX2573802.1 D-alanyl-D-alanine carboxypeptidase [Pedobacter sandarakinus]
MFYQKAQSLVCALAIIIIAGLTSCSTNKTIAKKVASVFKQSAVIKQYQVGFALYDMEAGKMIYSKDADKYFTPASNTKLYTFYASLKMIPEFMPALKYIERNDSLIFWGTGDPSFLQFGVKDKSAYNFLKASNKKLFFAPGRYSGTFFGDGWSWDDYDYYYQPEITEMPIMDNMVTSTYASTSKINIEPKVFAPCFEIDSNITTGNFQVKRDFLTNHFKYPAVAIKPGYNQQNPYKTSIRTTVEVLTDTLHKSVGVVSMKIPSNAKTLPGAKRDSVLKHMLLPSDNFIAEHLLLVCANQISDTLSTTKAIDYVVKNYLSFLPDKVKWADGSGLSRQNLFTPRDNIYLLDSLYKLVNNRVALFDMLPAGGKTGTLRNAYPKTDQPFVFGKTGSLGGVHNQSGYVITKKGKTYIYSFMNNNYVNPTSEVRAEMVRIMTYIHENF